MPLPGSGSGVSGGAYPPYPPSSQMGSSVFPPYPVMPGSYPYPNYQASGMTAGYPPSQGSGGMYPPYPPSTQPVSFLSVYYYFSFLSLLLLLNQSFIILK